MPWILIVLMVGWSGGVDSTEVSTHFSSEAACLAAAKQIETVNARSNWRSPWVFATCIEQR